ncbi:Cytochrome c oxidase assembly protein COX15 [Neonectria ditissima]|uniref:Cytochrome c oxidase assembly protein COX15 n=1 Tax=Neonectria ditissima TaxID=78410 RepID=A0A0P7ANF0_9HYPO|nr:Cytochrome c oxidase assembly protein COX15 [Neonectria ditissima]
MASFAPGFRRLLLQTSVSAPKFFVCNQCLRQAPRSTGMPSRILNIVRSRSYADAAMAKPMGNIAQQVAARSAPGVAEAAKSSWPKSSSKSVGYWLIGSAVSVFGIVVFGGLTRLTESGLSITEWRPVTGSMPPMSQADWESEFEKYRASPEFKLLNPHMNLDEFKKIYFMEWFHRLWGRFIGMTFVLPTLYFIARRRVTPKMAANLLGISALIGFQGVIGWWMVKSGLKDDLFAPGSHPRVSQYRLTTHLATAFVCYSWMLASGLAVLRTHRWLANPEAALKTIKGISHPALTTLRRSVFAVAILTFVTAMSGGLVAGLDAGLIYNEFPKMGLGIFPPKSELFDTFYSRKEDHSDLWWRNILENPSTVQMNHRILAVSTFCAIIGLFVYARTKKVAPFMPANVRVGTTGLVHMVSIQVILGISTLIYMVPIHLGAAHQAGALGVLSMAILLAHRLHIPRPTLRLLEQRVKQLTK